MFSGQIFYPQCIILLPSFMIVSPIPYRKHKARESDHWRVVKSSNILNPVGLSLTLKYSMYEPVFHDGIYKCEATIRTKSLQSASGTITASSDNIPLKSKQLQFDSPLPYSSANQAGH